LPGGPQVTIRHSFPPNFAPLTGGKYVHIQPYEFGSLPAEVHHSRWFQHHLPADWKPGDEVF